MRLRFPLVLILLGAAPLFSQREFKVEEASIADIQNAIRAGRTSCKRVVQAYLDRVKAYNGVCTELLTKDGTPVPPSTGMVRAGAPVQYPTGTVPASAVFPNLDQYKGLPLEFGHMAPSVSDPGVQLQFGLRVGIPDAGQLDALETLNIRGERSVTCKGDFDRAPSGGPLPPGAPAGCEEFRKQPDALERAAELDEQYGRNPDLEKLPMYCVVMSFKDWYDAKDMRGTGGNDVNFALDVPKEDSPDIAVLRAKGAIIFAVSSASNVPLAESAGARGPEKAKTSSHQGNLQYSPWSGQACNPYDTARVPRGTSNGSAVAVSANLSTCGICEQTGGSCKGPASRNGIVSLLTTKGILGDGGITDKSSGERVGVHCKSVQDSVLVLDALKGFQSQDIFSALPKGIIPKEPYAGFVVTDSAVPKKPLEGIRIGVVREFMVKHTRNDAAISDQLDKEIKAVLRDKLGVTLVESVDPLYPDDPTVPNMQYTFQDAFAEVLPRTVPEFFWQTGADGKLTYAVPGWDVKSVDYDVALALHKAPLSSKINLRTIARVAYGDPSALLATNEYLMARGDERIKDWPAWVANANFKTDEERARAVNAIRNKDPRPEPGTIPYLQMQSVMRMVILKVMYENKIDVFVNPEQTLPQYLLGHASEPEANGRASSGCCERLTALLGGPEIAVPAGFNQITYDPKYQLSADKTTYIEVTGDVRSTMAHPMPISLLFWAGPGFESDVIKAASAYEAATHHRVPPPMFGPVSAGEAGSTAVQ